MTESIIITDIHENIGYITLNKPEKHNAFDEEMIKTLTEAYKDMEANDNVRVIILRGNGKSFCAGGDLNWMRRSAEYNFDENVADAMNLGSLLKTINTCSKPTIAEVYGNVFGGGVGLCACSDIVIADENSIFCLSEVKIGLIPSIIAPYVINAIGQRQARRYFLSAERFNAITAEKIGLVHEAMPAIDMKAKLDKIVNSILEGSPVAQKLGKEVIRNITNQPIDTKMIEYTATKIAEARASNDGKEGLSAFLEKRKPNWKDS